MKNLKTLKSNCVIDNVNKSSIETIGDVTKSTQNFSKWSLNKSVCILSGGISFLCFVFCTYCMYDFIHIVFDTSSFNTFIYEVVDLVLAGVITLVIFAFAFLLGKLLFVFINNCKDKDITKYIKAPIIVTALLMLTLLITSLIALTLYSYDLRREILLLEVGMCYLSGFMCSFICGIFSNKKYEKAN